MDNKLDTLQDSFSWELKLSDGRRIKMGKGIVMDNIWYENKGKVEFMEIFYNEKLFASLFLKPHYCPKFYFTCICNTLEGKKEVILNFGYIDTNRSDSHISSIFLKSLE